MGTAERGRTEAPLAQTVAARIPVPLLAAGLSPKRKNCCACCGLKALAALDSPES